MAEIAVEVVLALPERVLLRRVVLMAGATVAQAVAAAGFGDDGVQVDPQRLGIFGRRVAPDHILHDGDRVEIYRPLTLDPKDARRRRARGH
ncbi:MAG: RnfH family protein [Frateuria sp.]|uniref:RnfH family protein n=1 Tax=Frateuria sp. TaxID=2211372 RepID=UPI0017FF9BE0|nr:RnfH family protein [Frateuria sp.]NUO72829.1 RnfH family protein [Frateuria sp.]NUR23054.1 RnfH family protein [Frateuria sp.]